MLNMLFLDHPQMSPAYSRWHVHWSVILPEKSQSISVLTHIRLQIIAQQMSILSDMKLTNTLDTVVKKKVSSASSAFIVNKNKEQPTLVD
jgi:prolyl oligopeptidase PreP (S9A serine peptidase family)